MPVIAGHAHELKEKIESRTAHIRIIGMGYVGLPFAMFFSEENFCVTGFDIDPKKIRALGQRH